MKKSNHPSFPNPTICEAVCEINFKVISDAEWQNKIFGDLFKEICNDFPIQEPLIQTNIYLQKDKEGLLQILPPQQWVRYKNNKNNLILQLTKNILTINLLPKYPGWEQMKEYILNYSIKVSKIIQSEAITQIGLRYINSIERNNPEETPGTWFNNNDYIPNSVLTSLPGFLYRNEFLINNNHRVVITVAEKDNNEKKDIILDIDCISNKQIEIKKKLIDKEIETLHQKAIDIFFSFRSPNIDKLLNKEN
jgi:uncharacterized protein (TIGR04255 family)